MLMDTNGDTKILLLKDLCSRLPYGVMVSIKNSKNHSPITVCEVTREYICVEGGGERYFPHGTYQLYLRPMSSMTEDERKELEKITHHTFEYEKGARDIWTKSYHKYHLFGGDGKLYGAGEPINMLCSSELCIKLIDWLNAHHFDYRGLIEKGLALEAPEGMYD